MKTVTLTVSGQLGFDRSQLNITVVDVTDPIARISGSTGSSGNSVTGGWQVERGETLTLSCATSSDNDQITACSWSVDGNPYGQQTTASFNWSDIGTHDVGLIVLDPSGNSQSTSVNVLVTDSTKPSLDQPLIDALTNQAVEGEVTSFFVTASDDYDANTDLRFHWDLNSLEDSDNNGNALDDPDYIGSRVDIVFDTVGTNTVILTVFDASNNSDSETFYVIVKEAEVAETDYGIFAVILFLGGCYSIHCNDWLSTLARYDCTETLDRSRTARERGTSAHFHGQANATIAIVCKGCANCWSRKWSRCCVSTRARNGSQGGRTSIDIWLGKRA